MNRTKTIQAMPVPPVYEQPDSIVIPLEIRLDKRLCPEVITCIDSGFAVYSKAYRYAFSRIDRGQRNLPSLTKDLQNRYGLKSRTANSIARDAKARHKAGLELLNKAFDGFEAEKPVKQAISVRILRRKKGDYVQFFLHLPKPEGWILAPHFLL